jgi:ATP adenylyltransferase
VDRLWAPWRIQYILTADEKPAECILCAFPARGRGAFREHGILCSTGSAFVIMNKFPYANGHVMVVPARHAADPAALPAEDWQATAELLRRTMTALKTATHAAGLNVGLNLGRAAGAGLDAHLHWHVVPRWIGDHNFMPVVADTKVISDALEASYERLLPHFAALGEGPA